MENKKRLRRDAVILFLALFLANPAFAGLARAGETPQKENLPTESSPLNSGIMVAQLTDEEKEKLDDLEREISKEVEQSYKEGKKKGRTNAAIWGCVTGGVTFIVVYFVILGAALSAV